LPAARESALVVAQDLPRLLADREAFGRILRAGHTGCGQANTAESRPDKHLELLIILKPPAVGARSRIQSISAGILYKLAKRSLSVTGDEAKVLAHGASPGMG
jgi:hypothetical protein